MENLLVRDTLDHLFRHEYGKLVALLTNKYSTALIDAIEDAVQEALFKASKAWSYQPMPEKPGAWLYRVANNHLIDQLRKEKRSVDLEMQGESIENPDDPDAYSLKEEAVQDEMLKMIFACCHPSLKLQEQLMLSLKLLCGLSTREIARALVKSEEATKKAIQRAKQKFRTEIGMPSVPGKKEIKKRLNAVLQVIYLLFNEGYKATTGEKLIKQDISEEAIRLAFLLSNDPECAKGALNALISLMLFKAARFPARTDEKGNLITLERQDRTRYKQDYIQWGWWFLKRSSEFSHSSIYQLEAAIACYYTTAETFEKTNWKKILELYDTLIDLKPSPIVKLSRAVVLAQLKRTGEAFAVLGSIEHELKQNQLFYAIKADLYAQLNDWNAARLQLSHAIRYAQNQAERRFLEEKLNRWKAR